MDVCQGRNMIKHPWCLENGKTKMARLSQSHIRFWEPKVLLVGFLYCFFLGLHFPKSFLRVAHSLLDFHRIAVVHFFPSHVETPSAMAIQRSSTSKSLVKIVVAAALGMLLSKSGSLPPVAVGPSTVRVYHYTNKAGYKGIVRSGTYQNHQISSREMPFYGSGVYGTQLDPSTPVLHQFFHNNYDRDGGHHWQRAKTKMDRAKLCLCSRSSKSLLW